MRIVDIIVKKRDGGILSREEIDYFIQGFTRGEIPDYQASALAMAILLNGMTPEETTHLTLAMVDSGESLDLSGVVKIAVDKHSTGGVGDKTTLVVEPMVAAAGLPVGKMSGRGLGFSGGTLDKLESIPGYRTDLTTREFLTQLKSTGLVLTGQTEALAPADGKLYALRDVTGTVQSIPLIASSVMSKKIAAGAQAIVLDVKLGLGAFMETLAEARALAEMMVSIARHAGRDAVALLSDMNQPLGCAVGNSLEVIEAVQTLHGNGPADFVAHCKEVAAHMLILGQKAQNKAEAYELAAATIESGQAYEKFRELVQVQGGDIRFVDQPERLPVASIRRSVAAPQGGHISQIHARIVGETAMFLGAGRAKKGDPIDHAVGIEVHRKVGDQVEAGEFLFTLHVNDEEKIFPAEKSLLEAVKLQEAPAPPLPLFYGVVS